MPFVRIDSCLTAGRCGRALVEKENWGLGGASADEKFPDKK